MKLTFKEKAKLFWDRNKAEILGWLVTAGVVTAIGGIGVHITNKKIEKDELKIEQINEEFEKKQQKYLEEEASEAADPANQLTGGGYIRPCNDNLYETDCPMALANCVPVRSMGEFGQDIIDRLNSEYPNWKEEGYFNPETAVADVWIDFGHEVWKLRNPEEVEVESQEKQAS